MAFANDYVLATDRHFIDCEAAIHMEPLKPIILHPSFEIRSCRLNITSYTTVVSISLATILDICSYYVVRDARGTGNGVATQFPARVNSETLRLTKVCFLHIPSIPQ